MKILVLYTTWHFVHMINLGLNSLTSFYGGITFGLH